MTVLSVWWRGKNGKTATAFLFFNGVAGLPFFLPFFNKDLSFRTPCQSERSGDLQGVRNLVAIKPNYKFGLAGNMERARYKPAELQIRLSGVRQFALSQK